MPFSLRASVAAAAGFLVLQARAEFDDLATLRSRGVGDYQVVGCGDDELLKSFRKVASFREDVPYAEVCGSICHEQYVGTRKGECYCAAEVEQSKFKTGNAKCEGEVPTIYRGSVAAGNVEGSQQVTEGPGSPSGATGPFGPPGGGVNKNEGENKKEFIQKGGVHKGGSGGGHVNGLKDIVDEVTKDTKKKHGKDKEEEGRDHDQWGDSVPKKHHHGDHKTEESIQVDNNLGDVNKPTIEGDDFKGDNNQKIDNSHKEINENSKNEHTDFGDKSKTGGIVNTNSFNNNNNTNSFNNNNNTYVNVNINLYNPIICIGDYCAPERKCEHGEACENYRVVCREEKCRPEVYHGEDRHHLVYCKGNDCHYHQCHEKAICDEKIVCKGDSCHRETCNGFDCHKKFVCGDYCHHDECKDDECHKKFICKEKECHPEPPCHGFECPRPPPPAPCPEEVVEEIVIEKPVVPAPPEEIVEEVVVEKPVVPAPPQPQQPGTSQEAGQSSSPQSPAQRPSVVPVTGASDKTFPAVCMFLVSAFAGLVLV